MASSAIYLILLYLLSLTVATNWRSFNKNYVDLSLYIEYIGRIIGGDVVIPHSYPFQVGLLINGNAFCGGTLISQNYVLTAAHCGIEIYTVEVILGAHNIIQDESFQLSIPGESVVVHEGFNYLDYQNDISLIKLSEPAPMSDYVDIVALPTRADAENQYVGETVTSVGWGLAADVTDHNPTTADLSPLLRSVNVAVQNISECGDYYKNYDENILYVTEKNVCTSGYQNKGTCRGDSGGPLLYNGVQIGLTSVGSKLCEVCSPSIFTKVGSFLDWIEEHSDVVIS